MSIYVAFLRGINLGNRRVKNDRLAELFEELGFEGVTPFLASGNVVFESPDGEDDIVVAIEAHLRASLGYEVDTFVRTMAELRDVAERDIQPDLDWGRYVIFLREAPPHGTADKLRELETEDDRFVVAGREVHWLRNGRLSDSAVSVPELGKALAVQTTSMRNMNTVVRIIDKFGD